MAIYTSILTGGSNNHETTSEAANGAQTDLIGEGIVGVITNTGGVAPATGAFAVNAQGTPAMAVDVSAGLAYVTATPTGQNSQNLRIRNTATESVSISANSTGSTKYDWIYLAVDATKAADPAVDGDDVASLVVSRSTSSSSDDGTPPTYATLLAKVTVANGATSITNGNIADARSNITVPVASVDTAQLVDGAVDTTQLADGAVTADKLAGDTVNLIDGNLTLHNVPIKQVSSDSVEDNLLVQGGWGYVLGSGSTQTTFTITLPETLGATPFVVLISPLGYKSGSNPSSTNDFSMDDRIIIRARCSTTTISGQMIDKDSTNMSSTTRFGYSWLVIGTKAS